MSYEDSKKVSAIIRSLNKKGGSWVAVEGYYALTSINYSGEKGKAKFDPAKGIPVKIFVNKKDGEVKAFFIEHVLKDKK